MPRELTLVPSSSWASPSTESKQKTKSANKKTTPVNFGVVFLFAYAVLVLGTNRFCWSPNHFLICYVTYGNVDNIPLAIQYLWHKSAKRTAIQKREDGFAFVRSLDEVNVVGQTRTCRSIDLLFQPGQIFNGIGGSTTSGTFRLATRKEEY